MRVIGEGLERNPHFLRLVIVFSAQEPAVRDTAVRVLVDRVRQEALRRLRDRLAVAFDAEANGAVVDQLARFMLAVIDGAFIAHLADASASIADVLSGLPAALAGSVIPVSSIRRFDRS